MRNRGRRRRRITDTHTSSPARADRPSGDEVQGKSYALPVVYLRALSLAPVGRGMPLAPGEGGARAGGARPRPTWWLCGGSHRNDGVCCVCTDSGRCVGRYRRQSSGEVPVGLLCGQLSEATGVLGVRTTKHGHSSCRASRRQAGFVGASVPSDGQKQVGETEWRLEVR